MKCISIKQPWAWLIVNRYKPVENRKWKTKYRGPILIHASKGFDWDGLSQLYNLTYSAFCEVVYHFKIDLAIRKINAGEFGGIVGRANLTDCVTEFDSPYFFGPYGFVMEQRHTLPFQLMKGQLGIFEVDDKAIDILGFVIKIY